MARLRASEYLFFLPIYFLVWLFIKIGQAPFKLIYLLILVLYFSYKEFLFPLFKLINSKLFTPKVNFPQPKVSTPLPSYPKPEVYHLTQPNKLSPAWRIHFNFIKRKRGRPRTQPLLPFYLGKIKRILDFIFPKPLRIGAALLIIGGLVIGYSYFLVEIARDLPSPERLTDLKEPLTTKIYDRNGEFLYQIYEGRNRSLVKLQDLPPQLINATVAIEDKHFFEHKGVDIFAILRAIAANAKKEDLQGGSTITQQLIKNTLLTPERTYERKIKEVFLAYWAERIFSKQEILQMYFNEAPYGGASWGIEAASETYFNKPAKDLSLAESAFLAGLPVSPTQYSPFGAHPEYAKERQKQVLAKMVEENYISSSRADEAFKEELKFNSPRNSIKAPHFVMYIRSVLAEKYGEKVVSQGGLKIITTLDLKTQEMAEKVVSEEVAKLENLKVSNGATMITDAKTGQILAMVGSKDYFDPKMGNFNVSIALRQPGSSIKPVTYATAFKQGFTPGTLLLDSPVAFKNKWEVYAPVNYDGKFHGPVTVRTALGSSYNVPAVKSLALVGIPSMIQTAKDLGITTFDDPNRYGLSLTLGGGEVRLIDMMAVYGTFSQMGVRHDAQGILKVVDSNGVVLEDNTTSPGSQVLQAGIAYMITSILTDNSARTPAFGPNSLLNIPGYSVAVKTGTTDSKRDNWTFGYTPEYVIGVWVGNNNNEPMDPTLTSGVTGATPIWNKLTVNLLQSKPNLSFVKPDDIIESQIDGKKDLSLVGQTPKSVTGLNRKKVQDDQTKEEKEVITFTDPFSSFTSDQTGQIKRP